MFLKKTAGIIYFSTFYLYDDIEKKIKITHANHSASKKAHFNENARATGAFIFLFVFAFGLGIIPDNNCDRQTPKTKNNHFSAV